MDKLLIICGPTATGKTALAAYLAKKFNGELISADSRQVFRGNDLETNKERPDVPIWLYDVANPGEEFSVSHWVRLATEAIEYIQKRGKLPIVVGGSGLYIKALLEPFSSIDVPPNVELRNRKLSVGQLQHMVSRGTMNDSDWNNPRRLMRKIEIAQGESLSAQAGLKASFLIIGLTAPLDYLYKRIDTHIQQRLDAGMNKDALVNEHAIARKQLTWFKKQKNIMWFDIQSETFVSDVTSLVAEWYTKRYAKED